MYCNIKRITPDDGYYFFGYYDLQPFDTRNTLHLVHKAPFMDRLQQKGDTCDIGLIELTTGKYEKLSSTESWNFQQGAMLQWNPLCPDREILFNAFTDGSYAAAVLDITNGNTHYLERPVANVSADGRYGLSINFSRMYDFRPGYGYATIPDPFAACNHPEEDGIDLIDMRTGKATQILSLDRIWEFTKDYFNGDRKLVINHITFNPDASRFVFLVRNFRTDERPHRTAVVTADLSGNDLFLLSDYGYFSHYYWINDRELMAYADGKELACCAGINNYLLRDKTWEGALLDPHCFPEDNHMSLSPDGRFLLNDTYPDEVRLQKLQIYDMAAKENRLLGSFLSPEIPIIDIRCDLHPRWSHTANLLSFDSTHEGFRGVYTAEFGEI